VQSAVFDQVRTCDNHCSFCFIYQLPPNMRKSLYLKDDDYRLSFLYGNFTTLTRFTEADLERVITERLSPLYVSIHATDPGARSHMLRNRRGAMSLRWLDALLANNIEVHGQVVVCPGVNDGDELERTMRGIMDRYADMSSVAVVPLGVSKFSQEETMRFHTTDEARAVVATVEAWQKRFLRLLDRRLVFCADEYYILAGLPFPHAEEYEDFQLHEDGIGMARTFQREFDGEVATPTGTQPGFFAWVEGAPALAYRAPRLSDDQKFYGATPVSLRATRKAKSPPPIGVLTSSYGAEVIAPRIAALPHARIVEVKNEFFGGNIGVAGLMVGEDLQRALVSEPEGHRYLLPDVCLSNGVFLDGLSPSDLPRPVEIVPTNGIALREALAGSSERTVVRQP
jgi:NifB/MoaA-like Fe-S oxidoreductase